MSAQSEEVQSPADMPRPTKDTEQITFRIPREWLAEADEVAKLISQPGMEASRTDAFRAAIARGFAVIRDEKGAKAPKKPARK